MRNGHYLGTARRFLDAAKRELTQGKIMQDDTAIRQAAEKGWGAALQATKGLLVRHGVKPPRGTRRMQDRLQALEKSVTGVRERGMYDKFTSALNDLHADAFYEGIYNLARIERHLHNLDTYIADAGRL